MSKPSGLMPVHRTGSVLSRLPQLFAAIVVFVAALVFVVGWLGKVGPLARPATDSAAMVPLSALSFAALGVALLIRDRFDAVHRGLAFGVVLVSGLNLSLIVMGQPDGLEALMPFDHGPADRMSPPTSILFMLAGIAVLCLGLTTGFVSLGLAVFGVSAAVCLVLLNLVAPGNPPMLQILAGMSLYSALAFVPLFAAIATET